MTRLVRAGGRAAALLACAAGLMPLCAQPPMSLEEAARRQGPDFLPVNEGKFATVNGQVSIKPLPVFDVQHLAIQDKGFGLILEGRAPVFDGLSPGDWVEARGRITHRAGLPVLVVSRVVTVSGGAAPIPLRVEPGKLADAVNLGRLLRVDAVVLEAGDTSQGAFLRIDGGDGTVKVFLPRGRRTAFNGIQTGDRISVTGAGYQYCVNPPYDRFYQVLIPDASAVERLGSGWLHQVWALRPLLVVLFIPFFAWWWRERRTTAHQEMLKTIFGLGEEVVEAASQAEIAQRIQAVLPRVFHVERAGLYVFDRGTRSLKLISAADDSRKQESFDVDTPVGLVQSSAVASFQNRSMVAIADTRKHPLNQGSERSNMPRAMLFVPMLAQGEALGALRIDCLKRIRNFTADEKTMAQHLANQAAVAVKLLVQRSFREQLSRTEKLAAVGRLISGVVNDLQTPLAAILSMSESAIENQSGKPAHELLVIASEARRASAIVSRLVSFAQPEQVEAAPVELNQLLRSLIRFREREWKASGIQLRNSMKDEPLFVMGSQGQLEQVFLNLFVHAEQALEDAAEKNITVRADVLAKKVFIEIGYNSNGQDGRRTRPERSPGEGEVSALGLDFCKGIIAGHGGEMRLTQNPGGEAAFEMELPWLSLDSTVERAVAVETQREATRKWTAMLLEPEEWVERKLIDILAARGYRVVPVRNSDEGLDLVARLRFDVILCSTRLPGLNWVEFFDRVRGRVGAFTLLAESFSHDLSTHFRGAGRYVLMKPIESSQFDRTLEAIEARLLDAESRGREGTAGAGAAGERLPRGNPAEW